MSAVATKIVEKYTLTPKMDASELSQYTSEFLKNLTDDRKRNQARRRLRDGFKFSSEQVSVLIPNQRGRINKTKVMHEVLCSAVNLATSDSYQVPDGYQIPDPTPQNSEETIGDLAQRILRDKLSVKDVRAEAYVLVLSAPNANAGSSRLSRLRRELRNLGASSEIIDVTKFPEITKEANEIQQNRREFVKAFERIDYPDHFTLESVKERLDNYNISNPPDLQALADVMIMFCIRPAELITLRITDAGVTGYAKNRGQPDIPRKFRSMEKNRERARELLTWIQRAISSGRMGDLGKPGAKWFNRFLKHYDLVPKHLRKIGAVYGAVIHDVKNPAHLMTIAGECLRHDARNFTSPVQNYVVVNYRRRGQTPEQARPFQIYEAGRCGLDLPLDELVARLSALENLTNQDK
ncbi:hypothetical protein Glove_482g86 [Diversispora epigaea]|uniref:Uncharacterized protein n=1 Tax=Diversispora epigaea TaxID=1348612 RepID=A0A397GNP9_9GLOM|nr:hypothetical protein Glove_482g86 [Diversispora epigaea]